MAERAIGLAYRELNDFGSALEHLDRAVRIAVRAGDRHAAALARLSRAYVLANTGRNGAALRSLAAALPDLHGVEAGHGRMQRGVVLYFAGRFSESEVEYGAAIALAVEHGDQIGEARARNNRGLVRANLGDPAAAERDFTRAGALFTDLGFELAGVDVRWNGGVAAAQAGQVPRALRILADADADYERLDVPRPALLLDRLELLLSIPLVEEAVALAERAVTRLRDRGMDSDLAEALLFRARVALLAGDLDTLETAAAEALELFQRQRRRSWADFARHMQLRAAFVRGDRSPTLLTATVRGANRLDDAGWTTAALAARIEAAQLAVGLGRLPQARRLLAQAAGHRTSSTGIRRAQGWYAESLRRRLVGDRRGALTALRSGLIVLDAYRAAVGAFDLRAHSGALGEQLARDGLTLSIETRRPETVIAWAERGRAGALRMTPARPPSDPRLAAALSDLRVTATDLRQAVLDGAPYAGLDRRRNRLETLIRDKTRQVEGPGTVARPATVAMISDRLAGAVLVEFVEHSGQLSAVLVRNGRAQMCHLDAAGATRQPLKILRFALQRLAALPEAELERSGARAAADRAASQLDTLLFAPMRDRIGDRPLVLVPTGALHATPWSALATCADHPTVVAPSATSWLRAASRERRAANTAVYVAGPNLADATIETRVLSRSTPDAVVIDGPQARVEAVASALDGCGLAHIAAHGSFRWDNPLFSAIELVDGPLTLHDLQSLTQAPEVLVLSACDLGLSSVRPGDELMGLTAALLGLGTRTLIASVLSVPSEDTVALMLELHRHLRTGTPAADALAHAQRHSRSRGARGFAAAASFVCFGAS